MDASVRMWPSIRAFILSRVSLRSRSPALTTSFMILSKRSSRCSGVISFRLSSSQQKYRLRCWLKRAGGFELTPVVESEIVDERRVEEQAIEPVEEAAVAWEYLRGVLRLRAALQRALRQVADDAEHVLPGHGGFLDRL